ncbi:MAG: acireductone synthase, partial [Lysobacterales bacterium]
MSRRIVITDIEGTTSSLSFVKEVLFPYAAKHLAEYVQTHLHDAAVKEQLAATAQISGISDTGTSALIQQLLDWIAADKKITPLKALQGMIWESGYETGAYKAHVYQDAQRHLNRWHEQGVDLYVYSSGSVYAQKLFFQYSEFGDLRALFSGYFDTTTGIKSESVS